MNCPRLTELAEKLRKEFESEPFLTPAEEELLQALAKFLTDAD